MPCAHALQAALEAARVVQPGYEGIMEFDHTMSSPHVEAHISLNLHSRCRHSQGPRPAMSVSEVEEWLLPPQSLPLPFVDSLEKVDSYLINQLLVGSMRESFGTEKWASKGGASHEPPAYPVLAVAVDGEAPLAPHPTLDEACMEVVL